MDINEIRSHFPVTKNCAYFQSAGMSPIPLPVLEKIIAGYTQIAEYGDLNWHKDMEKQYEMFDRIALMCGCSAADIAFTDSNSLAMSFVAMALKKSHKRINVVSMEEEFPSNTVPFEYQGIKMRYVQPVDHRYPIKDILEMCDGDTKAVLTSHVQYCTGFRQDIATLGKELKKRGILFIVNSTQGFPFFQLNMKEMNIDVLTSSVHKWGFCSHVGTLFMTSPSFREKYPTPVAGWLSVDVSKSSDFIHTAKNKDFKVWPTAKQYEFASSDLKGRLGLGYALDFLEQYGYENLNKYLFEISSYLIESLKKLPVKIISPVDKPEERSPIISFSLKKGDNQKLTTYLEEKKIFVAMRNGYIRASVNIFTNKNDVDCLCGEMRRYITET